MTPTKYSILVVDDEPYILSTLAALLADEFDLLTATSVEAAQAVLTARPIDIILTDQRMPRSSGVQLLEWVRQNRPRTVRLLMTGFAELEDAVEAINRGQVYRYVFKPWRADELLQVLRDACRSFQLERQNETLLEELHQSKLELEERVRARTEELEETNRQLQQKNLMLEKLALTDPLTGLPNRRAMDRLVEAEVRRRSRYPSALSLGLIDADHFKEINSRFLHSGGDQVLIDLGKCFTGCLRTVDTVARIGGEEFLVMAPETGVEGAAALAERIRGAVQENPFSYQGLPIPVTVSVGFAVAPTGALADYDQLKHAAAAALSEAKTAGRNRSVIRSLTAPAAASVVQTA